MARFTRKVEFRAYQFNPEEVKGMDDYDIEDVIIEALALTNGVKSAFVTPEGRLSVVLYSYTWGEKEHFELTPGEWLTTGVTGLADFEVVADEKFQELATPVE